MVLKSLLLVTITLLRSGILNQAKSIATINHKNTVYAVAWSPDGTKIATASHDDTAQVWDLNQAKSIATINHKERVRAVAWSPDGTKIATASHDNTAQIWLIGTPLDWVVAGIIAGADLSVLECLLSLNAYANLTDLYSPAILKTLDRAAQSVREKEPERYDILITAMKMLASKPGAPVDVG